MAKHRFYSKILIAGLNVILLVYGVVGIMLILNSSSKYPTTRTRHGQEIKVISRPSASIFVAFTVTFLLILFVILGCFGLVTENTFFLKIQMITLGFLTFMYIVQILWAIIASLTASNYVRHTMKNRMMQYERVREMQEFYDYFQTKYNCCGIDDKSDWYEASLSSAYIPHSCCDKVRSIENCTEQEVGNKIGCLPRIKDLRNYQLTFILINAVIGAFLVGVTTIALLKLLKYLSWNIHGPPKQKNTRH